MVSSRTSADLRAASWSSSIAPSTACSASLFHGAWRPAEGRSVEETAGDADVIPGWSLPVRVPEQGSWVIGNEDRDAAKPVDLVAERPERLLGVEQALRRGPAHREDERRVEQLDLAVQVRQAGGNLVIQRRTVLGRAAFDHVTDE